MLQIAQRQASVCVCSVRANLARPGWQQATSSVANEKLQQADAETASLCEDRALKARHGGMRKGMVGGLSGKIRPAGGCRHGVLSEKSQLNLCYLCYLLCQRIFRSG